MALEIRSAKQTDADALTEILNRIVKAGGTTAHQTPFDPARLTAHYIAPASIIECSVATENGQALGFQSLTWPDAEGQPFPDGWAIIATFVDSAAAGKGVGRALFDHTRQAAAAAGVVAIDSTIRADNPGGLAYYSKMGFVDYDILKAVPLRDGSVVDRIRKRFDMA